MSYDVKNSSINTPKMKIIRGKQELNTYSASKARKIVNPLCVWERILKRNLENDINECLTNKLAHKTRRTELFETLWLSHYLGPHRKPTKSSQKLYTSFKLLLKYVFDSDHIILIG